MDNTFLSPYYQRPLELGADIVRVACVSRGSRVQASTLTDVSSSSYRCLADSQVTHSVTKYINGFSE